MISVADSREKWAAAADKCRVAEEDLLGAVAALVVLVMLPAGMAYAANGAKPGDLLYGARLGS